MYLNWYTTGDTTTSHHSTESNNRWSKDDQKAHKKVKMSWKTYLFDQTKILYISRNGWGTRFNMHYVKLYLLSNIYPSPLLLMFIERPYLLSFNAKKLRFYFDRLGQMEVTFTCMFTSKAVSI